MVHHIIGLWQNYGKDSGNSCFLYDSLTAQELDIFSRYSDDNGRTLGLVLQKRVQMNAVTRGSRL